MSDSFAFRQFGVSAAAVLALALSACGGGGGGSAAQLAAAPASGGGGGAAPVDGNSAAAGAPPGAGEGGGSPPVESAPVEPGAGEAEPGVPVGEAPGAGGPAVPGGGSESPSGAAWHVFGEVGTGPNGAALVTAGDLAGVSAASLDYASRDSVDYGFDTEQGLPYVALTDAWRARSNWGQMAVRVGHNGAGQVSYDLTYLEGFGSGFDPADTKYRWRFDSEAAGTNVRRLSSGGRQGALFRREDSSGTLWAAVSTDISGPGDTDWLATGVWAADTGDTSLGRWGDSSHGHRFGVFATGGDPYGRAGRDPDYDARASLIAALTGTATYEGDASGVWSRSVGEFFEESRRNDIFSADAMLTIDFSAKPLIYGEGSASGRIHNIAIDGTPIAGNPEIALNRGIVNTTGRIWTVGHEYARMTLDDGRPWRGHWGAGLFGSPASGAAGADRLPSSVAGVFGLAPGGNGFYGYDERRQGSDYIIGAFGAYRTEWTDAPEGVRPPAGE